jgi:hypothetical protein
LEGKSSLMSQWFRFYESALDDPKVQRLPGDLFKGWINLLCLAKRHNGTLPPHEDIAFALRLSAKEATKLLDSLVECGLLDHDETGISPHNWNARQYKSDVSTDRVKRFRKRHETVSETPSESETDTETDSVAKATGGEPPKCDPVKALFDDGVKLLTDAGTKETQARSLIGKWRKAHGDDATRTAIQAAYDHGAIAPVEFITASLTRVPKSHETWDQRRIREAMEAIQ